MIDAGIFTAPETDERALMIRSPDWMAFSWMNIIDL